MSGLVQGFVSHFIHEVRAFIHGAEIENEKAKKIIL